MTDQNHKDHLPASTASTETAEHEHDPDPHSKRERIMQAALELFTERGFHGTPMPLVAERADVAAGTIYRYFESKEALVNSIFQYWHARLDAHIFGDEPIGQPVREQFRILFRRFVDFSLANQVAIAFLNLHFHSPYLDETSRQYIDRARLHGHDFFVRASEQQVTKPLPPELLLFVVDGVFMGLFRAHLAGFIQLDEKMIDMVEECAWAAVQR